MDSDQRSADQPQPSEVTLNQASSRADLEQLVAERTAELAKANARLQQEIDERKQIEAALRLQNRRERLVTEVAQHIWQSINLDELLQTTVTEVQLLQQVDRVLIYRLWADGTGSAITESVLPDYPTVLGRTFPEEVFPKSAHRAYSQGKVRVIPNIEQFDVEPCLAEFVSQFQVKAKLVVPILQGQRLWGLVIVHHCAAPRQWQQWEISLLQQLATQVGIAIQKSELCQQSQIELVERRRIEQELRQNQERYRAIVEDQTEPIVRYRADGVLTFANDAFCRYFGISKAQLAELRWESFIFEAEREQVMQLVQGLNRENPVITIENQVVAQGEIRWMQWINRMVFDQEDQFVEFQCVGRDVTTHKQSEQTILEQAALLNVTNDAILIQDLNNCIQFWNPGAENLYGWQAEEALGWCVGELFYKDVAPTFPRATEITLEQGAWQGELQQMTKTGEVVMVLSRWTLMRDQSGHPKSILTVDTNLTQEKQLEAQLLHLQRLESLSSLARGIAHDFNNLLAPILATAQLLPFKHADLDKRSQQLLSLVEQNARRGANLARQIQSLVGELGAEKRRLVQVRYLLCEIEQLIQQTFPKSIQLHTDIPLDLWEVTADPTQLHQMLLNLCLNARDAMPEGGRLRLSATNLQLNQSNKSLLDAEEGFYLMIQVADTGVGIPTEALDRIFEPFLSTREDGSSLGLAMVQEIVKNHDGLIRVSSQAGKGSCFTVYLPVSAETAMLPPVELDFDTGNGELVLVVDDEAAICESIQTMLETYNYRVLTARDGVEAIALYAQHKHDINIVLLDLLMPLLEGSTTILALQRLNPQVQIITMSGLLPDEAPASTGSQPFLAKPFTAKQLLNALQTSLKHKCI